MLHFILLLLGLSYFPKNGRYFILHNDKITTPGDLEGRYTVLVYSCDAGFDLTAPSSVCTPDNTWSTAPECNKRCGMVNSTTVNFECFSPRGISIPCSAMLSSGSVVLSSCKVGYIALRQDLAALTCRNGHWDKDTPSCDVDSCVTGGGESGVCTPLAALRPEASSQPSASTDEDVHLIKIAELVAQNVILRKTLQEFNISVTEQLNNISGSQADMVQIQLLQDTRLNDVKALLEKLETAMAQFRSATELLKAEQTQEMAKQKADILQQLRSELDLLKSAQSVEAAEQKRENSKLRAEVESLKTSLMQETAKKMADQSQLLKSELDSLKSAQTQEVAKLNSEISKWKTELESLKNAQTQLITKSLRSPHAVPIPGGVEPGWSVTVSGVVLANANYFTLDFECQESNCIAFHFKPYFAPATHIVRNHLHNGVWANEETGGTNPLGRSQPFQVTVTVENNGFKIDINYKYFCHFNHRLPYQVIRNLLISGDVILISVSVN